MSGAEARLRDRIGAGRALALIDGNSFYCSCERVFDARMAALSNAHNVLVEDNWEGASLLHVVERGLAPHLLAEVDVNRFRLHWSPSYGGSDHSTSSHCSGSSSYSDSGGGGG